MEVVDERPYQLDHVDHPSYIYEFGLRYPQGMPDQMREPFQDTIRAVWGGYNEIDGFNALVLAAGLTWRQATVLRAYAKYMKQGNSPFAVDYIEEALRGNTDITRLLVQLFEARFDPGRNGLAAEKSSLYASGKAPSKLRARREPTSSPNSAMVAAVKSPRVTRSASST